MTAATSRGALPGAGATRPFRASVVIVGGRAVARRRGPGRVTLIESVRSRACRNDSGAARGQWRPLGCDGSASAATPLRRRSDGHVRGGTRARAHSRRPGTVVEADERGCYQQTRGRPETAGSRQSRGALCQSRSATAGGKTSGLHRLVIAARACLALASANMLRPTAREYGMPPCTPVRAAPPLLPGSPRHPRAPFSARLQRGRCGSPRPPDSGAARHTRLEA